MKYALYASDKDGHAIFYEISSRNDIGRVILDLICFLRLTCLSINRYNDYQYIFSLFFT